MACSVKFSEAETMRFVTLYEEAECLWNFRTKDYKNKNVRHEAHIKIAEEMEIPGFGVSGVIRKIKSVRGTYAQELAKVKKSKESATSPDSIYVPNLVWFSMANRFLYKVISIKSSLEQPTLKSKNSQELDLLNIEVDLNTDDEESESFVFQPSTSIIVPSNNLVTPVGRKRKPDKPNHIDKAKGKLQHIKESVEEDDDDEFTSFSRHVASQLRQLPLQKALQCECDITNFLANQRIEAMEETNTMSIRKRCRPRYKYF